MKQEEIHHADFDDCGLIEYRHYRGKMLCNLSDVMNIFYKKDENIRGLKQTIFELEDRLSRLLNEEYHSHGNGD